MKRIVSVLLFLLIVSSFCFSDDFNPGFEPINYLEEPGLFGGLIVDATGIGIMSASGIISSIDLQAAIIMIQVSPILCSIGGSIMNSSISGHVEEWNAKGLNFDDSNFKSKAWAYTYATWGLTAGGLIAPLVIPSFEGAIASIVLCGGAVIVETIGLYGVKRDWLMALNTAIYESGMAY